MGRGAAPKFAEATVAALIAKLLGPLVTANLAPAESGSAPRLFDYGLGLCPSG